ncbi:MAG: amino acid-binding ACT domain protein [Candidatus Heimdallarchaeota archaeon]|nr:amino acid-binding ACT domain protein [Candidatus Heimdallarchaeota archaeon]
MWQKIISAFENTPSQLKVIKLFLEIGIRIERHGKSSSGEDKVAIYCGPIEQSVTKLANAIGVDRKVVLATCKSIVENNELADVFTRLKPVADISDVARYDKNSFEGVMDIYAFSDSVGIAALATKLLAEENIVIRYMVARDPELSVESVMTIVTDKRPPGRLVEQLLRSKDVIKVSLS